MNRHAAGKMSRRWTRMNTDKPEPPGLTTLTATLQQVAFSSAFIGVHRRLEVGLLL
jgi:hypothetical protein